LVETRLADLLDGSVHWRSDCVNASHGGFLSPFASARLTHGGWPALVEADAERFRSEAFSHQPSRLACLFVFRDMPSCQQAHQVYGWDLTQLSEMTYTALRSTVADMEIVSYANSVYEAGPVSPATVEHIWQTYWSGGTFNDLEVVPARRSIWEVLIDGCIERRT
jgi:hypothetical protein